MFLLLNVLMTPSQLEHQLIAMLLDSISVSALQALLAQIMQETVTSSCQFPDHETRINSNVNSSSQQIRFFVLNADYGSSICCEAVEEE